MKCGIHIIHDGGRYRPSKYEVLKKCGEPRFRQGNTWVYNTRRGTSRMLKFNHNGYLASMQEGPR